MPNGPSSSVPLSVQGLTVRYGQHSAVRDLTFHVQPSEIYGLLGSNGAGKTSTIKSIVGLVQPFRGNLGVFGIDPLRDGLQAKQLIGYVPETPLLFDALTPREFLEFIASVRRLPSAEASRRTAAFVQAFQIAAEFDRPISTLSNGVRQKVLLIAAFLHEPRLLILDEPFNNLDPRAVRIMKDLLLRYARQDHRGVLFSTHTMEVAEQLCGRVGILDRGVLRAEGPLSELRKGLANQTGSLEDIFLKLTAEEEGVRDAVRTLGGW
jgi:ABC-2 type transport system ATP-binding protein